MNAKLDFEAKKIFYHVLDCDTLNHVLNFDTSNKIWRFLIGMFEGQRNGQSNKSESEESTSDVEAIRSCFVAHENEVASTSTYCSSSDNDNDIDFDIHKEFSFMLRDY